MSELNMNLLSDQLYRLENLYLIKDDKYKVSKFKLRPAQRYFHDNYHTMNCILKSRQIGFSTYMCVRILDETLFDSDIENMLITHKIEDSQDMFLKKILFAYDNLPEEIRIARPTLNRTHGHLRIEHSQNHYSSFRVSTSARSGTLKHLHVSEFGKLCAKRPRDADEIISGALNAGINQNTTFESTAEGAYGHFYDTFWEAYGREFGTETKMQFRAFFFNWLDHPECITDEEVYITPEWREYFNSVGVTDERRIWWYIQKEAIMKDKMKQEFPTTPKEAFEKLLEGTYYAEELNKGQIIVKDLDVDVRYPVHTCWDIGRGDSTVVIMFQNIDGCMHIIDHFAGEGQWAGAYIKKLEEYDYNWGFHFAPHDIGVTDWASEYSRAETIYNEFGFRFTCVPKISFQDGIDAVRYCMIKGMKIGERRNEKLIQALRSYRRAWSDTHGTFMEHHHHDWTSDYADSLRYGCIGMGMDFNQLEGVRNEILKGAVL
jgi:hypothetical protein